MSTFFINSNAQSRACVGQTRMYTFLYPYMGIISSDNVHNVKVTARVRLACIHAYIHIWALYHVTLYTMLRLLRGSDAYVYIHIWLSCHHTMYSMLRLLRGVRRAYIYSDVHIWLLYTHVTMCTMLRLLRGSYTVHVYDRNYHIHIWALHSHVKNYTKCLLRGSCTWQRLSHPYMGIV